jgi:hypothetical protein
MSHWFSKGLGDPLLAGESLSRIEERFRAEYESAGGPPDMAVFVRHESEGRLHCEVRAYFSPAAARVASAVAAAPCSRPYPEGLGLLAGAPASWRALFPDRQA